MTEKVRLTKNFWLHEFEVTKTGLDNKIPKELLHNVVNLAGVMQRIRDVFDSEITINSGYRSPMVNRAVGGKIPEPGKKGSAHLYGLACDFTVKGKTPYEVCKALEFLVEALGIDQLIYEGTWVHVGLSEDKSRHQVLTARFGQGPTKYETGINR